MAGKQVRRCAALAVAQVTIFSIAASSSWAGDRPNRVTPSDRAAGQWFDSLLDQDLPGAKQPTPRRRPRRLAQRRSNLRAKLVNNPDTSDGSPAFALVDRYGGVLRYVEPVDDVDLERHLGETVGVRHDTGDILLASQLALPGTPGSDVGFQLAQYEEPIAAGEVVGESSIVVDSGAPIYLDEGLDFGGCPSCGSYTCGSGVGCGSGIGGGNGSGGRGYVRAEYLLWFFDGMETPPLVTTSDPVDQGVLPNPGMNDNQSTRILFGGDDNILDDGRNGGRIIVGIWIDDQRRQAIEADYFGFASETERFSIFGADGNPIISRPFFDFNPVTGPPPQENAQEVSSDTVDGRVTVEADSQFHSFGVRLRHNLCCTGGCCSCADAVGCGCGVGVGCGMGVGCGSRCGGWGSGVRRIDLLTGFRYARLDESLRFREDLIVDAGDAANPPAGLPPDGTTIVVRDRFSTENEFVGGEIGFLWEVERRRWSLELLSKLAIGSTRQFVAIAGDTTVTLPAAQPNSDVGGLLALSSNIGTYERDEFSVIPEIGFTFGYRLAPRLRLTAGYTLFYWTNVVRPGDQIDRDINSELLPGSGVANPAPLRPLFSFENTNIWGQGINAGADFRW